MFDALKSFVTVIGLSLLLSACGADSNITMDLLDEGIQLQSTISMRLAALDSESSGVSDLGFCLAEFRLFSEANGARALRVVTNSPSAVADEAGTALGTLYQIPPGKYHTIEMVLRAHGDCDAGSSARILRSGDYESVSEPVVLRFQGDRELIPGETTEIELDLARHLAALEDEGDAKSVLEPVTGSF